MHSMMDANSWINDINWSLKTLQVEVMNKKIDRDKKHMYT